ncbi:MAG: glutathione S-transferase C-terminal domain-containing protein [Betaproteobacteria bacterium]
MAPAAQVVRLCPKLLRQLSARPYFDAERFSLVDVVFGPIFRYFDAFDRIGDFGILAGRPTVAAYRQALSTRPSVRNAVAPDYNARLWMFLQARNSHLSRSAKMA